MQQKPALFALSGRQRPENVAQIILSIQTTGNNADI
jgi:hypothetical protein